ncbi:E3 ubiquitin-protein ligase SPL2 [Bienertia sinuspersici]
MGYTKEDEGKKVVSKTRKQGYELQVDEVNEEGILPLGNVVTVVGVFSSENGIPTMKPSKDVPYFMYAIYPKPRKS